MGKPFYRSNPKNDHQWSSKEQPFSLRMSRDSRSQQYLVWMVMYRSGDGPWSGWVYGLVGIPKPELTPRSIPTPRFQPMSSYPLYSSLMFCCSQAPISIAIKRLAQPRSLPVIHSWPRHHSSSTGDVSFPQMVMGWPPSTLSAYTPWWPEVNYIRKGVLHHQFLLTHTLIPHPSLFQHPWPLPSPFTWP